MKEMIKRIREERGGFTLAELLIVVAIVLVLVAIAVPVYTGAMDNAQKSVASANLRAVKSQASAQYMLKDMAADTAKEGASYTATLNKEGDVTKLEKDATKASDSDTVDEVKNALQAAPDGGTYTVTVVVTPDDVAKTTNP